MSQSITMEPNSADLALQAYPSNHFHSVLESMKESLHEALVTNRGSVFQAKTDRDLWKVYSRSFPLAHRQYHKCDCCQRFISRFGKLVCVNPIDGKVYSALWDERTLVGGEQNPYFATVKALRLAVESATEVQGVYISEQQTLGTPEEGGWEHLSVRVADVFWTRGPNGSVRHHRQDITAEQAMAAKRLDHETLIGALEHFSKRVVHRVRGMLATGGLDRSDKFLPQAEFLLAAFIKGEGKSGAFYRNALWTLVADAPAGWCSPKNTSLGALIEDVTGNYPLPEVVKRHNARVAGDKYQRPTTVKEGNIAQAETLFEKLNLARSTERRFATLGDIQPMWLPADQRGHGRTRKQGLFAQLSISETTAALQKMVPNRRVLNHRAITSTFTKFKRDVLRNALRIQAIVPAGKAHFGCFTTAVHPDAEPLLAWDRQDDRNPVAWYQYTKGSEASNWKLQPQTAVEVRAISLLPPCWNDTTERWKEFGSRALFVMQGAADRTNETAALFPEILRGELHGVRSTIEAFSKSKTLAEPAPEQGLHYAAGLLVGDNQPIELLVWVEEGIARYLIDRWE